MTLDKPNILPRCSVQDESWENGRRISIVPQANQEMLSERQLVDYYEFRKQFLSWLQKFGKDPDRAKGYSDYTVFSDSYRTAQFDRWNWEQNGYTIPPDETSAQAYMEEVALDDTTESTKGKKMESLLHYSKYLTAHYGRDPWEFPWSFKSGGGNNGPRDFLSLEERRAIRQAALNMDDNPSADDPNTGPIPEDHDSWKFTSLVWASLDGGLRPVEVREARVGWVDTANGLLRIPREDSAKNEGNWAVSLTDRTTVALERWLEERAEDPKYQVHDRLWLTRKDTPYTAKELRRMLHGLCEHAGIEIREWASSPFGVLLADARSPSRVVESGPQWIIEPPWEPGTDSPGGDGGCSAVAYESGQSRRFERVLYDDGRIDGYLEHGAYEFTDSFLLTPNLDAERHGEGSVTLDWGIDLRIENQI